MSDDSDNEEPKEFHGFYGKALEPYDEDSVPKKRPITIEDQVAKDAQGRRRFHGAFTGGFSAGFYNTVGSLEGWKPAEFKSSRSEKAQKAKLQRPEDYMDDEDMGEFGIAPQTVKATNEFNTSKKRKKQVFSDGPIPGDPVLHTLIQSGNETIGYLLLRNMGYKHGDDGDDEQAKENETEDNLDEIDESAEGSRRVYGCEMPKAYKIRKSLSNITYNIPDIYKTALGNPKSNTFGMGYSGLERSHVNLFSTSKLVVNERNNKKLSISGQAFGVGAFEDDDEDIYVKEDITKYDFELTAEKAKEKKRITRKLILDMFVTSQKDYPMIEKFLPPSIPASFTGKHKVKRSRFEPLQTASDKETPKRHEIDAATRAMILGEGTSNTRPEPSKPPMSKSKENRPEVKTKSDTTERENVKTERSNMFDVGPSGLIFDKFVSASKSEEHTDILQPVEPSETTHGTKDMRDAAKMKMFGRLTRISESWLPNSLLCKRFNVPEPTFGDVELKAKHRRHRNLIFESAAFTNTPVAIDITFEAGLQKRNEVAASAETHPAVTQIPVIETISEATTTTSASNNTNLANVSITPATITPSTSQLSSVEPATPTKVVEEQKALDPTEKLDISKNVDLFKAVFMDSESDTDSDEKDNDRIVDRRNEQHEEGGHDDKGEEQRARDDEIKAKILSEDLLLPQIKPIKHGILSNVESIMFDKPKQAPIAMEIIDESIECSVKNSITEDNMYGPRLPGKITYRKPEKSTTTNLPKVNNGDSNSDTDWVEKDDGDNGEKKHAKSHKHKKEKKHKKDKHKTKKHKRNK